MKRVQVKCFGVPIEKIQKGNIEYELRQKGKVAELALGYQRRTRSTHTNGSTGKRINRRRTTRNCKKVEKCK